MFDSFQRGAYRRIAISAGVHRVFVYFCVMGMKRPLPETARKLVAAAAVEGYKTTAEDWLWASITDNPVFVNTHRRFYEKQILQA